MFDFSNVLIIGTGLIGSSIALALKKKQLVKNIIGIDIEVNNLKLAKQLHIIDEYFNYEEINLAVQKADWIILCTPVGEIETIIKLISSFIMPHTIISDIGSTKINILDAVEKILPINIQANFIALHPIAGSEKHGPSAASAELFNNKSLIIVANKYNNHLMINNMQKLWEILGSKSIYMNAYEHDEIFSLVSHLPHVLSFAFMDYIINLSSSNIDNQKLEIDNYLSLSGSGFRDFTRIAASSPTMWKDICIANKPAILHHLAGYIENLQKIYYIIEQQDNALLELFNNASKIRQELIIN